MEEKIGAQAKESLSILEAAVHSSVACGLKSCCQRQKGTGVTHSSELPLMNKSSLVILIVCQCGASHVTRIQSRDSLTSSNLPLYELHHIFLRLE